MGDRGGKVKLRVAGITVRPSGGDRHLRVSRGKGNRPEWGVASSSRYAIGLAAVIGTDDPAQLIGTCFAMGRL